MDTQVSHPDPVAALQLFPEDGYSITQLAALSGLTPRQLAWMDEQGALKPSVPARGSGRHRRYSEADAARARLASALRRLGAFSEVIAATLRSLPMNADQWPPFLFIEADGSVKQYAPSDSAWFGVNVRRLLAEPAPTPALASVAG